LIVRQDDRKPVSSTFKLETINEYMAEYMADLNIFSTFCFNFDEKLKNYINNVVCNSSSL
jgi:hypothetical protein